MQGSEIISTEVDLYGLDSRERQKLLKYMTVMHCRKIYIWGHIYKFTKNYQTVNCLHGGPFP